MACHLGTGGSSVAAIKNGISIDTSMGYSPLLGLMMSTRSGDIDPMLTIYLMVAYGFRPDALLDYLNKRSGMLGVSGFSSDIRDIVNRFSKKNQNEQPELAFNMFIHRLKKYIGSYIIVLGGIDILLFTDDIGIGNSLVREKVCKDMEWSGLSFDEELNKNAIPDKISVLNSKDSRVHILSVPNQEEMVIVWEGITLLKEGKA